MSRPLSIYVKNYGGGGESDGDVRAQGEVPGRLKASGGVGAEGCRGGRGLRKRRGRATRCEHGVRDAVPGVPTPPLAWEMEEIDWIPACAGMTGHRKTLAAP